MQHSHVPDTCVAIFGSGDIPLKTHDHDDVHLNTHKPQKFLHHGPKQMRLEHGHGCHYPCLSSSCISVQLQRRRNHPCVVLLPSANACAIHQIHIRYTIIPYQSRFRCLLQCRHRSNRCWVQCSVFSHSFCLLPHCLQWSVCLHPAPHHPVLVVVMMMMMMIIGLHQQHSSTKSRFHTLNTTPAMVVPVLSSLGADTPLASSMAFRLHSSKLKPPAFDPMLLDGWGCNTMDWVLGVGI